MCRDSAGALPTVQVQLVPGADASLFDLIGQVLFTGGTGELLGASGFASFIDHGQFVSAFEATIETGDPYCRSVKQPRWVHIQSSCRFAVFTTFVHLVDSALTKAPKSFGVL